MIKSSRMDNNSSQGAVEEQQGRGGDMGVRGRYARSVSRSILVKFRGRNSNNGGVVVTTRFPC